MMIMVHHSTSSILGCIASSRVLQNMRFIRWYVTYLQARKRERKRGERVGTICLCLRAGVEIDIHEGSIQVMRQSALRKTV